MLKRGFVRWAKLVLATMGLMVVVAPSIGAAESGTVTATVTAATSCIEVQATSVNFLTQPFSTNTADQVAQSGFYNVTNCSSGEASFLGHGTDATGDGFTWALDGTTGGIPPVLMCEDTDGTTNRFRHSINVDRTDESLGAAGTFITTTPQTLNGANAVPAAGVELIQNQITMPCTGSDGAGLLASFSATYTAVLNP